MRARPAARARGRQGRHRRRALGEADRGDRRGRRGRPLRRRPAPRHRQGQEPAGAPGRVPSHPHQRRPRSRRHPVPDPRQALLSHVDRPRRHRPPPPLRPQRRHRPNRQRRAPPLRAHLPRRPPRRSQRAHRRLHLRRGRRAPHLDRRRTGRCRQAPTPRSSCGSTSRPCSEGERSTARPARSPASARSRCRSCGSGWTNAFLAAIVTKGTEITKVVHLGRKFTSEQRTALQWRDPICARKGCANRLRLAVRPLRGLGRHPHHPVGSRTALLPALPPPQDARLERVRTRRRRPVHLHPAADRAMPHHRPARPSCTSSPRPPKPPSEPAEERSPDADRPDEGVTRWQCQSLHEPIEQPGRADDLAVERSHPFGQRPVGRHHGRAEVDRGDGDDRVVALPGAWTTSTPSSTPSSTPARALPSSTTTTGASR